MIDYLHEIPGLEGLEAIGESFDVDITAHGRLVRRAYTESRLRDPLKEIIRIGSIAAWRKSMSRNYRDSFASLVP